MIDCPSRRRQLCCMRPAFPRPLGPFEPKRGGGVRPAHYLVCIPLHIRLLALQSSRSANSLRKLGTRHEESGMRDAVFAGHRETPEKCQESLHFCFAPTFLRQPCFLLVLSSTSCSLRCLNLTFFAPLLFCHPHFSAVLITLLPSLLCHPHSLGECQGLRDAPQTSRSSSLLPSVVQQDV
ncbi:hypothetical protein B0J12DRAFT_329336 [Macrophomina phaseolina]|uniref:Transmembrane protein n=1 Tax=Macrophomina phaseolina TaxID=35725 RepID=A0ABQ8FV11_9PEZI|nr:hypothetical protein B0J12DRAFT_329336 [Macrophomina phaseolina]